jgi:hypothetical protein
MADATDSSPTPATSRLDEIDALDPLFSTDLIPSPPTPVSHHTDSNLNTQDDGNRDELESASGNEIEKAELDDGDLEDESDETGPSAGGDAVPDLLKTMSSDEQQVEKESEDDESNSETGSSDYSDDDEEEEPTLKYARFGGAVSEILEKDSTSSLAISAQFIVRIIRTN